MDNNVQRGQIYFVSLEPTFGHELGGFKMRPVVVVSIPKLHNRIGMVVVVPGTSEKDSSQRQDFPNQATVHSTAANGLQATTIFQGHQVRAVSIGRIVSRSKGVLSEADLNRVLSAVRYTLGIEMF